jgi:hypothetical protein
LPLDIFSSGVLAASLPLVGRPEDSFAFIFATLFDKISFNQAIENLAGPLRNGKIKPTKNSTQSLDDGASRRAKG